MYVFLIFPKCIDISRLNTSIDQQFLVGIVLIFIDYLYITGPKYVFCAPAFGLFHCSHLLLSLEQGRIVIHGPKNLVITRFHCTSHLLKPIKTTRIPQSTVLSSECSTSTKRRRTQVMENIRKEISLGDEREQQQHEIAHARLRDILGPGGKVVIPTQDLLELKSFFGLSWKKLRRLKR